MTLLFGLVSSIGAVRIELTPACSAELSKGLLYIFSGYRSSGTATELSAARGDGDDVAGSDATYQGDRPVGFGSSPTARTLAGLLVRLPRLVLPSETTAQRHAMETERLQRLRCAPADFPAGRMAGAWHCRATAMSFRLQPGDPGNISKSPGHRLAIEIGRVAGRPASDPKPKEDSCRLSDPPENLRRRAALILLTYFLTVRQAI